MNDDPGVLGRLPRSRPGTRSAKRVTEAPAQAAKASEERKTKASGAKAEPGPKGAAQPKAGPKAKAPKAAPKPKAAPRPKAATPPKAERPAHAVPPAPRGPDPLTDAVRAGVRVAEGGIKLAGGITRELLRRLPRP